MHHFVCKCPMDFFCWGAPWLEILSFGRLASKESGETPGGKDATLLRCCFCLDDDLSIRKRTHPSKQR